MILFRQYKKKGKYYGHHFIVVEGDNTFRDVRVGWDLEHSWRKSDHYKHLSIVIRPCSNKYYIKDSQMGEIHSSHFDARLIDIDTLYYVLETIKKI